VCVMDIPAELIAAFPPSADLLLDLARRKVDDAMLTQIARADYGYMADAMLAELRPIRDKGIIPAPMQWQLLEVLSLTRWCDPERLNPPPFEPGPTGRAGHQILLFACAVLLRATAESANQDIDSADDGTLAQCLVSAKILGEEMSEATARFLTWRIPRMVDVAEPVLYDLALLILAIRLRSGRFTDRVLGNVAEWVLGEESQWQQSIALDGPSSSRPSAFSLQRGFWQPLAAELKDGAAAIGTDEVRENVRLCALVLGLGSDR
jgi:hypothetical protein